MDFLRTKGIEYLLAIAYLLLMVPFGWWLARSTARARSRRPSPVRSWFSAPEDLHYHRGHTWARAEEGHVLQVGIDDFAGQMLGPPNALRLPRPGDRVEQGERGWQLQVDGRSIDLLSPVDGTVTEVNEEAVADPTLVTRDPYGRGWLMRVHCPHAAGSLHNLLPGPLAKTWLAHAEAQLSRMSGGELGVVLQDGGLPVPGFVREIGGDDWPRLAAELLLTDDDEENREDRGQT